MSEGEYINRQLLTSQLSLPQKSRQGYGNHADFQTEPDYDVVLENLTIATYTTYYGKDILIKNVNIASGEKLVVNCKNSIVIKDSFIAERGSEFEFI